METPGSGNGDTQMKVSSVRCSSRIAIFCWCLPLAFGLDPQKSLTQYTRTIWTQKDGLPQELIKAITQTSDGHLWLATDEGLVRFDGYAFQLFTKAANQLPSNSITALATAADGSLWIGTAGGVSHYDGKKFRSYTTRDGLPDNAISDICVDHDGVVWIVAGGSLARLNGADVKVFKRGVDIPFTVRAVHEDPRRVLWVAGFGAAELKNGKFISRVSGAVLGASLLTTLVGDAAGNLWMAGGNGVVQRSIDGRLRNYGTRDGLPDAFVRTLAVDSKGTLWAGSNAGLARLENGRFSTLEADEAGDRNVIWSIFEDREKNLWAGANNGLSRFRDDIFTSFGKPEGLPGDDPNTIFQDHLGRIWIGFHNHGLMLFSATGAHKVFDTSNGFPSNEVFSIRETRDGRLLLGTRRGVVLAHDSQFRLYRSVDEMGRTLVLDALEDSAGMIWVATQSGLSQLKGDKLEPVIRGGPLLVDLAVTLAEGKSGELWAGTPGKGLWRIKGEEKRLFTQMDGMSSDNVHSLYQDPDGTLWIATFGGGLNALRDGKFVHFSAKDGLLSDNISDVTDDGESLWLSTTRGISRISRKELRASVEGKSRTLHPTNYGVEDGLRSAQLAFGYIAAGGTRISDGRIWFPTTRGLAVIDPKAAQKPAVPLSVLPIDLTVDSKPASGSPPFKLPPGSERIGIQYAAIHLTDPGRVQYFYKLEGLEKDWVATGRRREINYNSLPRGKYQFRVKAELPGGISAENQYEFELLPRFHETTWFRLLFTAILAGSVWGAYRIRLRRLHYWFTVVMEERTRLAREIHDTLAQGFVGISSQLNAVAMALPGDVTSASRDLELAQRMARYCTTEARRSVLDLRASVLDGRNLGSALQSGAQIWTAGSGVKVEVEVPAQQSSLPDEVERNLLRIAQEAVTNAVKHAQATKISVTLRMSEPRKLYLRIADNGRGFKKADIFSSNDGHFGLIGMRERALKLGTDLHLASQAGEGTRIEVMVSLP
jgi:ligand-binding sensor domain-containing protein